MLNTLTPDEKELLKSALDSLATRQPQINALCDQTWTKIETGTELASPEQHCLTIALQGECLYVGPMVWPTVQSIIEKLGLAKLQEHYLKSWIDYAERRADDDPHQRGE